LRKSCALAVVCAFVLGGNLSLCAQDRMHDQPRRIGVGVKLSTLGGGIEAATRLTRHSNVRAGFNTFAFDHDFTKDGVAYVGHLNLRSLQANYDWFPFGGSFHLSPGLLVHNGNRVRADASMPMDQSYGANFTRPITGNGTIEFSRVAPMLLVGWGNLVSRRGKRLSFPFEIGVIYHGAPRASLNMNGVVCDSSGVYCLDAASDAMVQNGIRAEQSKLNHDVSPFKFYPVISFGVGYSF
jgi:hypothetical protein